MRAYFLAYGDDMLLGEAENLNNKRRIIGAFKPGVDGNYYQQILVGFVGEGELQYTMGFSNWWEWCKALIKKEETLIDDEFSFDLDDVRVISVELDFVGDSGLKDQ